MAKKTSKSKTTSRSSKPVSRIRNPVTGTYYRVRVRSTSAGNRGTIVGKWSPSARSSR